MDVLYLIAQIVGYVAIAESVFIFISNKREKILIFKLIDDALWFTNMLLMGAYTGAVLNAIAIVREIVFFNRGKKKWATHKFWLFFFMIVMLVSPVLTWAGPVSILPAMGSCVAVICFYAEKPIMTKYLAYLAQGSWLAYAVLTKNWSSTICNIIALISATIGIIHEVVVKRKAAKNVNLNDGDSVGVEVKTDPEVNAAEDSVTAGNK